jgi:transposase IS116/IS110/IS902 family protein
VFTAWNEPAPLQSRAQRHLAPHGTPEPTTAGQLLTTVGDNPQRMRSEAAFAHLCGVAPIPASSGKTRRHRLNRGGDRAANNALYTVVLTRLRLDDRTHRYVARRTTEGLSRREIIRCLQRYVARELHRPWSVCPRPRRPGRLRDWRGWINPETPKARAAGLMHPLQSLTIEARRGHQPEPLDTDIGASWRSPTTWQPGATLGGTGA